MKKLLFLFSILLFVSSCKENDNIIYNTEGAVYFQVNSNNWSDESDSLVYSFAGKENDEATLSLLVDVMGIPTEYERSIKISIDPTQTTAVEGTHYQALATEYTLPANELQVTIPITVYNNDPELENRSVQLALKLEPTDDLKLGITARTTARIVISNILNKPIYWEDYYMDYYFGPYSRVKHEYIIREVGRNFPDTAAEYMEEYSFWSNCGTYMDNFFTENYPIYDENNLPIEPWL